VESEVWELGLKVVVWAYPVLGYPPVREDGDVQIAHVVGEQAAVVGIRNWARRVVSQHVAALDAVDGCALRPIV
jgi:hypothetical protein